MAKRFICLLMAASAMGALPLFAQEGATAAALGTLTLDKKSYTLKRALAYETTIDNEDAIAIVLSVQPMTSETLQEARATEKEGGDPNFKRPFLRLVFKKTGEIKHWSAAAGGTQIGRRSGTATGELKLQNSRVSGKANVSDDIQGMFPASFDVRFDVPLLKSGESMAASTARKGGPAANVKPTVTGMFKGNGKEAKLAFVSARWVEPFAGKPGIQLVFTEKDHSKNQKPDFDAMFGKFGNALIISLHEDGQIYSCQVVHSAHERKGFSAVGEIEAPDFAYEDGKVEGEITTNGPLDIFGETWEVKIKFLAPLGEIPKEFQVAESKPSGKEATPAGSAADGADDDEKPAKSDAKPAEPELKAKDLALTKDAADIEYKALVEQLAFRSKANVKSACAELAANLKAQGWKNDGSDLVNPQSSILKRKRGEATLTIFVKPAEGGSEVKMMTEGLSWE
ncbi:MAG TPA: hypothetical protein VK474_05370 [Chthoniobacterales bacterium]|nr:hypothetical protein [Chthoniobacterales bacterium]